MLNPDERIRMDQEQTTKQFSKEGFDLEVMVQDRRYPRSAAERRDYMAKPRLYFHVASETVLENFFVGRRNRPVELYKSWLPEAREAIIEHLRKFGRQLEPEHISFRWSQKAGCFCGCSPGFIVTGTNRSMDIWIKIKAADKELERLAQVIPQAVPNLIGLVPRGIGRGESGKLRNFKAMTLEKLLGVSAAVIRENDDPEALAAIAQELEARGRVSSLLQEAASN